MLYCLFRNTLGGEAVPLYEYKCVKCGRATEKIEPVSGPHLKKCPHCGGKVERQLTAPAIQFKGSGWYVTDYAGKGKSGGDAAAEKPGADAKESGAKDSTSKDKVPKDSGSKDKKAAKKKE